MCSVIQDLEKWTKRNGLAQTLVRGGHRDGPETYEKMLGITSHQREADESHCDSPLHTGDNGHPKQIDPQQGLEWMWREGTPSALLVGTNADWRSHRGKQCAISSEK